MIQTKLLLFSDLQNRFGKTAFCVRIIVYLRIIVYDLNVFNY